MIKPICSRYGFVEIPREQEPSPCSFEQEVLKILQLDPADALVFPRHKGVFQEYLTNPEGQTELRLYLGEKEIAFDEPELFPFGERIHRQGRFIAGSAVSWGKGYQWPRIKELLQELIREKILFKAGDPNAVDPPASGPRPSPLPPAKTRQPSSWLECESLTDKLTGRVLELFYLECAVPVFRVAHIALDSEGRQVGEANVFPSSLRLDRPTDWRGCPHAGSRYQDAKPMNVTAHKSMRAHWPQMMATLHEIREAFVRRFPHVREGWTVGDMQRLSTLVLALPAYLLMKPQNRVEDGTLHPVLSSLFRVTDGVQMTTSLMLYSAIEEPTRAPRAPISGEQIYSYAERYSLFHSAHAVCAGPPAMIQEFLRVLFDEQPIDEVATRVLDLPVRDTLKDLDDAFNYGLLGLQSHALIFSLWPRMGQCYEQLLAVLESWPGTRTQWAEALHKRLCEDLVSLWKINGMHPDEWNLRRTEVYSDMYARCAEGLGESNTDCLLAARLERELSPIPPGLDRELQALLGKRLRIRDPRAQASVREFVSVLIDYFRLEQATLRVLAKVQTQIGSLLGRAPAKRPLKASDLTLFYHLRGQQDRLPYLPDSLNETIGLQVIVTPDAIAISDQTALKGAIG